MEWYARIKDVQKHLQEENLSGWLLFNFGAQNPLATEFLQLDPHLLISRRFFYWIPQIGEPVQVVHTIEKHVLSHLPGSCQTYLSAQDLNSVIGNLLKNQTKIAMEYSPSCGIPYLSKVDGGTLEWIRHFGVEVVSSGNFLQYYTCMLSEEQLTSHLAATHVLEKAVDKTWALISNALKNQESITESHVRAFLLKIFEEEGCMTHAAPICAVNAHSASPHFEVDEHNPSPIRKGDFVLIDLWCKQKKERAIYGDITRVAVADTRPTARQKEIFQIVRGAQRAATEYVQRNLKEGKTIKGAAVDRAARSVIEEAGYGQYFTHRTGHNIYTQDHGPGAHLDSLETVEDRCLLRGTCFSVEPGIYLPGEFGVRLEYDVYLPFEGDLMITGGVQEEIKNLL